MTKTYVVSGRGIRFEPARWPLPPNVEIHFYFRSLRRPQFFRARNILDELMLDAGMFPERVAVAGDMVPSCFCWSHPDAGPRSGVFRRRSGHLAMDLAGSDPRRPVALSHVVRQMTLDRANRMTVIHWIVQPHDGPVDLAALDCLYPSRLHGAPDDEKESDRIPLIDFPLDIEPWPEPVTAPSPPKSPGFRLGWWPRWTGRAHRTASTRGSLRN